jgi:DNA-binding YbaB/EbfC family protein
MNPQAMMKQVQKIQKEMMKTQEEINNSEFEGKNSLVTVVLDGQKKLKKIKFDLENFDKDDIEMLEDMIVVAHNEAIDKIDKITEEKMGTYTKGLPNIPGLF